MVKENLTQNQAKVLWEVFIQNKDGKPFVHVGSVHAYDAQMALQNARDVYTRRREGTDIWVVKTEHIIAMNVEDRDSFLTSSQDKPYRYPQFYNTERATKKLN